MLEEINQLQARLQELQAAYKLQLLQQQQLAVEAQPPAEAEQAQPPAGAEQAQPHAEAEQHADVRQQQQQQQQQQKQQQQKEKKKQEGANQQPLQLCGLPKFEAAAALEEGQQGTGQQGEDLSQKEGQGQEEGNAMIRRGHQDKKQVVTYPEDEATAAKAAVAAVAAVAPAAAAAVVAEGEREGGERGEDAEGVEGEGLEVVDGGLQADDNETTVTNDDERLLAETLAKLAVGADVKTPTGKQQQQKGDEAGPSEPPPQQKAQKQARKQQKAEAAQGKGKGKGKAAVVKKEPVVILPAREVEEVEYVNVSNDESEDEEEEEQQEEEQQPAEDDLELQGPLERAARLALLDDAYKKNAQTIVGVDRSVPFVPKDMKEDKKLQLPVGKWLWPTYNLCRSHAASVGWPSGRTDFSNFLVLMYHELCLSNKRIGDKLLKDLKKEGGVVLERPDLFKKPTDPFKKPDA